MDPYNYTQEILKQWGPGGTAYHDEKEKLAAPGNPKKVFISHGHDDVAKLEAKAFLEELGLEPIILSEQPNAGRVILEKFEDYSDVGFAVILLTGDDWAHTKTVPKYDSNPRLRARQNVIMELGYFIAKLGKGRVCVLLQDGVEVPSNITGVVTIRLNKEGKWRSELAREIDYEGLSFDKGTLA